jgi:hypothetical protein
MKLNSDIEKINLGRKNLIHKIKLILYNKNPDIFREVDFENDLIYSDPILFAGINSELRPDLTDLLWGYMSTEKQFSPIKIYADENGVIYLPNTGYFYTKYPSEEFKLVAKKGGLTLKGLNDEIVDYYFEPSLIIDHNFEILRHPYFLLKEHFYEEEGNTIDVEISEVTKYHLNHLTIAFDIIKQNSPEFYGLLKLCVRKVVVFRSEVFNIQNTEVVDRNSFATLSVHGCAFFNAFQDSYNEVFFIEDIAHQCGHIIFNTYLASEPDLFIIAPETNIASVEEVEDYNETRSLLTVLHAMYTYDCIFTCFYDCLVNDVFRNEHRKRHELLGRLAFSILKFVDDLKLLSQKDRNGKSVFFSEGGLNLLRGFYKTYEMILENFSGDLNNIDLSHQPYNFSYEIFLKYNSVKK